jgi:signal transduction histidine kinase
MKRKKDNKRGLRYYFIQTFAVVFAFAFLIGFIIYYYMWEYEQRGLEAYSYAEGNYKIYDALENMDDSEITENSMKTLLTMTMGIQYFPHYDYCTVVYDTVNDKFYDSSNVIYCIASVRDDTYLKPIKDLSNDYFNNNYFNEPGQLKFNPQIKFRATALCSDPDLLEQINSYQRKHTPDHLTLEADDVYIKEDSAIIKKCTLSLYNKADRLIAKYDITSDADIPEGYVHFQSEESETHYDDAITVNNVAPVCVGTRTGSYCDSLIPELKDFLKGEVSHMFYCKNGNPFSWSLAYNDIAHVGTRWKIYTVSYFNLVNEFYFYIIIGGCVLTILAGVFSYLIARIRHIRYRKEYEMNEYRNSLTAALAHDLKTPLAAISGYAENLIANVHTEKRETYAESILKNAQYIDRMIADTLDLAKIEKAAEVSSEQCNIEKIIKDSLVRFSDEIQAKEMIVKLDGSGTVKANPQMMSQMITNLIENAVRYTPEKGCIEINAEGRSLRITNDVSETVKDAPELIKAFRKGDAARSSCSGSGLGLSIVKQISDLHGFRFDVNSENKKFTAKIKF